MGIAWLLTGRGIPQMYYGTEVLMKGISNPDGWVRLDFPGGWEGDKKNAFTKQGLSNDETDALEFTHKLANFRKSSSAIKTGKLMHYVPENGIYVYFRYDEKETVMCILNANDREVTVNLARFSQRTAGFNQAKNILTGITGNMGGSMKVPAKTLEVLELVK